MGLLDVILSPFSASAALRRAVRLADQRRSPGRVSVAGPGRARRDRRSGVPRRPLLPRRRRRAAQPREWRPLAGEGGDPGLCRGAGAARHAVPARHGPRASRRRTGRRGLFGAQTTAGPNYRTALNGRGAPPRAAPPTARRCSASSSAPGRKPCAIPAASDAWYKRSAEAGCPQGQLGYALVLARDAAIARNAGANWSSICAARPKKGLRPRCTCTA